MKQKISIIDAFTSTPFAGNPAAVVPLEHWLSEYQMQAVASENNLSETAFVVKGASGIYEIRWFSPLKEIDFCGHATLASAYAIFSDDEKLTRIRFWAAAVGTIEVTKTDSGRIEMAFPAMEPVALTAVPLALQNGLSPLPEFYLKNTQAYFAIYKSAEQVRTAIADFQFLKTLGPLDVVISAPGEEHDFVSRYFWPANGGEEDPVTGSIHAGLAPYWAKRLNKTTLVALQASVRSGTLYCRVEGDRVFVSGHCVPYLEGYINLPL